MTRRRDFVTSQREQGQRKLHRSKSIFLINQKSCLKFRKIGSQDTVDQWLDHTQNPREPPALGTVSSVRDKVARMLMPSQDASFPNNKTGSRTLCCSDHIWGKE